MISDFIIIDKKLSVPLYQQIYNTIKKAIENGSLKENEKIPSVRKLCSDLEVSKTTVETAYNLLCAEGYIINYAQKGYYVEKGLYIGDELHTENSEEENKSTFIKYDFSGKGIDKNCSNIKEWRKYVKDILNKEYLLNTYSENQGEEELRKAIAKYSFSTRGVKANFRNIVIGAGSQTLIAILCGLVGLNKTVAIEKNFFPQAEQVFRDFNYQISYTHSDNKGTSVSSLNKINPDILLINTNHNSLNGLETPVTRKLEIIKACEQNDCLIIEDDYNCELKYKTHPSVCIQSYAPSGTVYIGSFSKILMPSVRISYMILPDKLAERYEKIRENYNQTTSKVEQLALARYINDLKLEKHLRKARRYYKANSEYTQHVLKRYFSSYNLNETSKYIEIPVKTKNIQEKLIEKGVKIMSTSTNEFLRLNFSMIDTELIEDGIKEIVKACD